MNDSLQRLIELWNRSLDEGLDRAAETELKSLLSDAPLVERFSQWQASVSPSEGLDHGPTPALDAAVLKGYRRFLLRGKAVLAAVAAMLSVGLGLAWIKHSPTLPETPVQAVGAQHSPLTLADEAGVKAAARSLGLPPGYGSRATHIVQAVGQSSSLSWTGQRGKLVHVLVLNSEGQTIRNLWRGHASSELQSSAWDGKDTQGRPVTPGAYRLVAYSGGKEISSAEVELSLKP